MKNIFSVLALLMAVLFLVPAMGQAVEVMPFDHAIALVNSDAEMLEGGGLGLNDNPITIIQFSEAGVTGYLGQRTLTLQPLERLYLTPHFPGTTLVIIRKYPLSRYFCRVESDCPLIVKPDFSPRRTQSWADSLWFMQGFNRDGTAFTVTRGESTDRR